LEIDTQDSYPVEIQMVSEKLNNLESQVGKNDKKVRILSQKTAKKKILIKFLFKKVYK